MHGPQPYHPNPNEENSMDDVQVASQELNTQEFDNSIAAFEAGVQPEFLVVTRSKETHWIKFPVSCFDKGTSLTFMSNWAISNLKKVATIKPKSFSIANLPVNDGSLERFLIFQLYSSSEADAACKHGGKNDSGEIVYFALFTPEARALQQGRVMKITSLSFDTTGDHVRAALNQYGAIESVRTGFNAKATMITATVIFESAKSIDALKEQNMTYVQVREDIATVTLLGNSAVRYDSNLTKKLALLPIGITPVEIEHFLTCQIKTPNGVLPFHSITMPLNLYTKKRQPEAYIQFSSVTQQELATKKRIKIDTHETCWIDSNKPTCRHCGDPTHFVNDCRAKAGYVSADMSRRSNINTIKGKTQTPSSGTRPFTQVPNTNTSASVKKQTTSARTSSANSYSDILRGTKNQGSTTSNPISIGTHTPTDGLVAVASTNLAARPAAVASSPFVAHPGTPSNKASTIKEQMAKLEQQQKESMASMRAEMQNAKSQGRSITPPTSGPAYSVNTLRPNIQGGLSIAKADLHRDESTFTRKEKGKMVSRETPQDNILTPQQAQQTHQQEEMHTSSALANLNTIIEDLRNDLARQGEQHRKEAAELRAENKQLRDQINELLQCMRNNSPNNPGGEEDTEWGECEYHGSQAPHIHHRDSGVNSEIDPQETLSDPEQ
ncbi:hypothetical protein BGZ96_004657 [Linnemannia gamsii]|uniref:CCHC-type domain-containing protein n=1 Tax=Linnemannia gamsii TaxID=64522 RepID=A0ABQ7JHX3_9FUNG|nr:hypothetical protein BGZ96_004657 [Linnemannia gamsii]